MSSQGKTERSAEKVYIKDYPKRFDVLCGCGKYEKHSGNIMLEQLVKDKLTKSAGKWLPSKDQDSTIAGLLLPDETRFLKFDREQRRWYLAEKSEVATKVEQVVLSVCRETIESKGSRNEQGFISERPLWNKLHPSSSRSLAAAMISAHQKKHRLHVPGARRAPVEPVGSSKRRESLLHFAGSLPDRELDDISCKLVELQKSRDCTSETLRGPTPVLSLDLSRLSKR